VFLNSSVSEGLPLALGEAALTGAPVVCTDVGASLRVLTNPDDGSCFSAVVAPNDAFGMARAQIKLLALLEEWSQYADNTASGEITSDSSFPINPTPDDIARITQRMYEQSDARRALGMRTRAIVQKSFSGDRYLREHEQMLWIGKARQDMARSTSSRLTTPVPAPRPVELATIANPPVQSESDDIL
jgi:glycosyltransferase involved in cell wall biosynthesis